jgi:hypothetical protein
MVYYKYEISFKEKNMEENNILNIDFSKFWNNEREKEPSITLSDKMIKDAEDKLKYKLPESYIELLKNKNGGYPVNDFFPINDKPCSVNDYITIDKIFGIGNDDGIDGKYGSRYMIEDWDYPNIGIMICSCFPGGHDAIFLDYRQKDEEPRVTHIDLETGGEPEIRIIAKNFKIFIEGLTNGEKIDVEEENNKPKLIKEWFSDDF